MLHRPTLIVAILAVAFLGVSTSLAQEDPAAGDEAAPEGGAAAVAAAPAPEALSVVVTGVRGLVRVRASEDAPWEPARAGMQLGEGAEFRTGPRSAVQFKVGPTQTITLDRLGTVKVLQAIQDAGANQVTTDLGMEYGRTNYKIEAAGIAHESTVRSPSSTLAIRGSNVTYEDTVWGARASGEGRLTFIDDIQRTARAFGGGIVATIDTQRGSAASTAKGDTNNQPVFVAAGNTEEERRSFEDTPGTGVFGEYNGIRNLREAEAQVPPVVAGAGLADGPLDFFVFWQPDDFFTPVNVDLVVILPDGTELSEQNPLVGVEPAQGEFVTADNGMNVFGLEQAGFQDNFAPGPYKVSAIHKGGTFGGPGVSVSGQLLVNQADSSGLQQEILNLPFNLQPEGMVMETVVPDPDFVGSSNETD